MPAHKRKPRDRHPPCQRQSQPKKTKSQRHPGHDVPVEGQGVRYSLAFEGGNKTIVAAVKQEMAEKVSEGLR